MFRTGHQALSDHHSRQSPGRRVLKGSDARLNLPVSAESLIYIMKRIGLAPDILAAGGYRIGFIRNLNGA
jgi:hypothetical protein